MLQDVGLHCFIIKTIDIKALSQIILHTGMWLGVYAGSDHHDKIWRSQPVDRGQDYSTVVKDSRRGSDGLG